MKIDTIVLGKCRTLEARGSLVEAIAIAGGRIVMAGRRDTVLSMKGADTAIADFGGATIVPGFNDAHAHLDSAGLVTMRHSLSDASSVEAVVERVKEIAAGTPKGEWVVTMPLGQPPYYFNPPGALDEGRLPDRHDLDRAAPDHPVYLSSPHGFWGAPPCYSVLNSRGLALNGIDKDTVPRVGSVSIERDDAGEPTGVLVERGPLNLLELDILPAVPSFSAEQRVCAIARALPLYAARGTTSIYEGHGCAPAIIDGFRSLHEKKKLTVRTHLVVSPPWKDPREAPAAMRDWLAYAGGAGLGDDVLRVSGIFVVFGGDPVIRDLVNAQPEELGWGASIRHANSPAEFEAICMAAGNANLRVHTLASDRLHELVPIFQRIAARFPIGRRRWVVEHVSRARPADLDALARLGIGVTLIPIHYLWKTADKFAHLEAEELDLLSPARALLDRGVPVAAGTDAVPNDPLFCLWALCERKQREGGRVIGPGGVLDRESGLRLMTSAGAWFSFEEAVKGRLLPGFLADLAVLSGDPVEADGDEILEIRCLATMMGGQWTFLSEQGV